MKFFDCSVIYAEETYEIEQAIQKKIQQITSKESDYKKNVDTNKFSVADFLIELTALL